MAQIFGSFQRSGIVYQNSDSADNVAGDIWMDHANAEIKIYNGTSWEEVGTGSGSGFTGSQGAVGFTGSKGDTGFTGSTGFNGSAGAQGLIGFTGSRGVQGNIGFNGSTGDQGLIGFTGSKGDTGFTGSTGFNGSVGFTGSASTAQGPIGFTGSKGDQGTLGFTGSQGDTGTVGFTGSQGDQGVVGFTGSSGAEDATLQSVTTNGNTTTTTIFATTSGQHEGNVASRDGSANVLDIGSANDGSDATITADVTGDVVGDVTGSVTGDVLGNLTGNVTGEVNGNVNTRTGTTTVLDVGTLNDGTDAVLTADVVGDVTSSGTSSFSGTIDAVGGQIMGNIDGDVRTRTGSHKIVDVGANGDGTDSEINIHDINIAGTLSSDDITSTSISITGDMLVTGDTVMTGNLTVNGETTIINSNTITSGDALIVLNADLPSGQAPSLDSGLEINRGSSANVQILWVEGSDYFELRDINGVKQDLVIGNLTSTGIDDNATSTAITIDVNENVGIGVSGSNLNESLVIQGSMKLRGANAYWLTNTSGVSGLEALNSTNLVLKNNAPNGELAFESNGTERMRIASDGNITTVGSGNSTAQLNVTNSGTASSYLRFSDAATTASQGRYIGSSGDNMVFGRWGVAEHMRIDSAGNVGIGGTPTSPLHVFGDAKLEEASPTLTLTDTSDGSTHLVQSINTALNVQGAGQVRLSTSATERMRIDSAGNVGIGTAPAGKLHTALATSYGWGGVWNSGTAVFGGTTSTSGAFGISYNDTDGAVLGAIAPGVTWKPVTISGSAFTFKLANTTAAMTVDASGNLLVGKAASNVATPGVEIRNTADVFSSVNNSQNTYHVYDTTAQGFTFYVSATGTINAVNTTISALSDERLKENVRDLDDGLDKVMALQPRKFDWKTGKGRDISDDRGFIAQEFETVFPDMVNNDGLNLDENGESYKTIGANLVPTLVKAIQEQQEMIETLQAEVAALKGA